MGTVQYDSYLVWDWSADEGRGILNQQHKVINPMPVLEHPGRLAKTVEESRKSIATKKSGR
jgi:hypothetical protein